MAASKSVLRLGSYAPLLVILGATGSGKSKLAIELAKKFNEQVISCDSMQVYKGLDIVTNKVSVAERQIVMHHLIDFVDPLNHLTVTEFRNLALKIINDLINEGKMPMLVGGTNYYIESVLWHMLVDSEDKKDEECNQDLLEKDTSVHNTEKLKESKFLSDCSEKGAISSDYNLNEDVTSFATDFCSNGSISGHIWNYSRYSDASSHNFGDTLSDISQQRKDCNNSNMHNASFLQNDLLCKIMSKKFEEDDLIHVPNNHLHNALSQIDPDMAERLHPADRRKVIRSLQVFQQHGRPHSEILAEQHSLPGGSSIGGPLRFNNTCILWLQCDQEVLNDRLDKRIDSMIEEGLIQELHNFHSAYNQLRLKNNMDADYTKGIFQSIGFKEFHSYLMLSEEERKTPEGEKLLSEGITAMKLVTKRYSKKQIKWIKNRFLGRLGGHVPPVYSLDATDTLHWKEKVLDPAIHIIEAFIQGKHLDISPLPLEERAPVTRKTYFCKICQRAFVGSDTWEKHLKSRRHAKVKRKLNQNEDSVSKKNR